MAINYLKDSQQEISSCKSVGLSLPENTSELITQLAHSHGMLVDSDPHDFVLPDSEAIGVLLSPVEISDVGFYLFYYQEDNDEECLVYSSDYGRTAKKTTLKKERSMTSSKLSPVKITCSSIKIMYPSPDSWGLSLTLSKYSAVCC